MQAEYRLLLALKTPAVSPFLAAVARLTAASRVWSDSVRHSSGSFLPTFVAGVVTEEKGTTTVADLELPKTGTVTVNVVDQNGDPVAAKVSIVGPQASPDPLNREPFILPQFGRFFGYNFEEKGDVFGLAAAKFADASGTTGTFELEPGTYRAVVSHGYEFDVDSQPLVVTEGANTTINATVHHVVDTTGFVSIDTHVHMINSPDSTITRERRITSMIAEGVDFFVNTDHDFVHSLADEISNMGVGSKIANSPAVEVTTSHYGHFNVWPLTVDNAQLADVYVEAFRQTNADNLADVLTAVFAAERNLYGRRCVSGYAGHPDQPLQQRDARPLQRARHRHGAEPAGQQQRCVSLRRWHRCASDPARRIRQALPDQDLPWWSKRR